MFNFFQFSKKDLLPNEPHSENIISHMRIEKIKQKDFDKLKHDAAIIATDCSSFSLITEMFSFINKAINYSIYRDVRNKFDLDFYYQDLINLYHAGSQFIGKQQLKTVVESLEIAYPTIVLFMEHETKKEAVRKQTIEEAGFIYTRHIYPDYTGCDELFYDLPPGPEDSIYAEAKKIVSQKKNNSLRKTTLQSFFVVIISLF